MRPELNKEYLPPTAQRQKHSVELNSSESEIILQISHAYTILEHIVMHDAVNLTDSGKANIRRAQAQIQRLRLRLLDFFQKMKEETAS